MKKEIIVVMDYATFYCFSGMINRLVSVVETHLNIVVLNFKTGSTRTVYFEGQLKVFTIVFIEGKNGHLQTHNDITTEYR